MAERVLDDRADLNAAVQRRVWRGEAGNVIRDWRRGELQQRGPRSLATETLTAHHATGGHQNHPQSPLSSLDRLSMARSSRDSLPLSLQAKISDIPTQVVRQNSLATLVHPHIVHLREWFESRDKFYLVFELAAGGELYEHLIDVGRFGEEEAREVTYALAVSLLCILK